MERLRKKQSDKTAALPTEILNAILSYLSCDNDLVNLSQVSHRFNTVIEPILYRTITLEMPKTGGTERWFDRDYRFRQLANTLVENPHVRRYIVKLQLLVFDDPVRVHSNRQQQILTLVPSLRELVLRHPPDSLQLHTLEHLESLCIDFYEPLTSGLVNFLEVKRHEPLEMLARILWIRTLKRLCLKKLWWHHYPKACLFPEERQRTAAITDLAIMQCPKVLDILPFILNSIKVLKKLVVEGRNLLYVPLTGSGEPLRQILSIHKNTLVELCIVDIDGYRIRMPGVFERLRDYTSLRRLAIPAIFLPYDYDQDFYKMLPGSLETCQLQCDRYAYRAEETRMESLAKYKFEFMPVLRSVCLWESMDQNHDNIESFIDRLTNRFEDVGVTFSWITGRSFSETPLGMES